MRGIHRSLVDSPHKGEWRGALMFSLICASTNSWTNNWDTGDLRCHCTHYDVTEIYIPVWETKFLDYSPQNRCPLCSIQNSTRPSQFSTQPAQNALVLASRRALVSLTVFWPAGTTEQWPILPVFAKLYSPASSNNSILAGVQYILYIKFCLNIDH